MCFFYVPVKEILRYLQDNNSCIKSKAISQIAYEDLSSLTHEDASEFLVSLRDNKLATQKHYRATLNQFYKYMVFTEKVSRNPFEFTKMQHKEQANLKFLDNDEKMLFINNVSSGSGLSKHQKTAHEKNKERNMAICALFLSTGIRISELVGLDLPDIDMSHHRLIVTRKGARERTDDVYMSDDAEEALRAYMTIRDRYSPAPSDKAVFLSEGRMKKTENGKIKEPGSRISVKTVERMVAKYVDTSVPEKAGKITPHKLRATFAETILQKTGNIELTKDLLGHKNIASTTHYVTTTEDEKKNARNLTQSE